MPFQKNSTEPPPFQAYFSDYESMNEGQRQFYKKLRKEITDGRPIDIDDNISYIFCYLYEILSSKAPDLIISKLCDVKKLYPEYEKITSYCDSWISDSYVLKGDIAKAINTYPKLSPNSRSSSSTDSLLSLKIYTHNDISGLDVLTLFGPKVTKFAKDNLKALSEYIDIQIAGIKQEKNINLLREWADNTYQVKQGYKIFTGSVFSDYVTNIPSYCFSLNKDIEAFASKVTKEAENTYREENGIPRIGEGWIAETKLYYQLKEAFPEQLVMHHARPNWLGRQHLDIFIHEYNVAIEYQGLQHDQPVEFFGGEEAFLKTQRRDARKKRLCKKNRVKLIYVREGYSLDVLIQEIKG